MSSLPQDVDAGTGSGPPVAWWSAATQVESDVVLSGAVLLFVALAFVFVVYHYFTISRRAGAARQQQRGTLLMRGGDTAAGCRGGGGGGGVDAATLRVMPVTVYCRAKDGEALECAVCLAELADGEAARFLPRCGHGFHAECVDLWLTGHTTCPLCRVAVDVDRAAGFPLLPAAPPPSSLALPPALPEPANYPTNLPTNVLFWGSHDAVENVVVAAGGGGGQRSSRGAAGAPAAAAALVIVEVRDRETAPAPAPRGGGAEKARELARLSSLRRLWNRGRHDAAAAAASSSSCPQTSMATDPTEQAPATALDIWNLT